MNSLIKALKKLKAVTKLQVIIGLIFIVFLATRLILNTGLVNCQSQDDGMYLASSMKLANGNLIFPRDFIFANHVNPSWIPYSRVGMVFPTATFIKVFGVNDFATTFFSFMSSVLIFFLLLELCKNFFKKDRCIKIIAVLLLTFFPLNVVYSTRIMPEMPLVLFTGLAILFFIYGTNRKNDLFLIFSGISIGLAYLVKESAIISLAIFPLYYIFLSKNKKDVFKFGYVIMGFVLIFLLETAYFYKETGFPFYRISLIKKAHMEKMGFEYGLTHPSYTIGFLNLFYPNGYDFFQHFKSMINTFPLSSDFIPYGYLFILTFLSIPYIIFFKKREAYFLILWFLVFYLYLEFGFTDVFLQKNGSQYVVNYFFVFKETDSSKLLNILTLPSILLASYFLIKSPTVLRVFLIVLLVLTSAIAIEKNYSLLKDGMKDTKEAAMILKDLPAKTVYTDYLAVGQINYFLADSYSGNFIDVRSTLPFNVKDGYVVVGGARGCDITGNHVTDSVPEFALNPPTEWILIGEIPGKTTWYRSQNMKMYYVPK